jgi:hypothetical protein
MEQDMAHVNSDLIDVTSFLNLTPGMWWKYKDTSTQGEARVECSGQSPGELQVRVLLSNKETKHSLQANPVEVFGTQTLQYIVLRSSMQGQPPFTWGSGLALPNPWKVGEAVSATSNEGNPATGNRVILTAKLDSASNFKPPSGTSLDPNKELWGIQISQTLRDAQMGTVFMRATMIFPIGLGLLAANSEVFGVHSVLRLQSWGSA